MFQNYIVSQNFNASDSDVFFLLIINNFHPKKKRNKMARLGSQKTYLVLQFCRSRPWELHQSGRGHTSRALNTDAGPNRRGRGDSRGEDFWGKENHGWICNQRLWLFISFHNEFWWFQTKKREHVGEFLWISWWVSKNLSFGWYRFSGSINKLLVRKFSCSKN